MHELNENQNVTWPALPLESWQDTLQTVHLWTQMSGKVKLILAPPLNHWWHVTLSLSSTGLTTGPLPYEGTSFQIDFDFVDHQFRITTSDGRVTGFRLEPMTVAEFYERLCGSLDFLGLSVDILPYSSELPEVIFFADDTTHRSYDAGSMSTAFQILSQSEAVMRRFGNDFLGKRSPVQFFWGAFDLAVTRFSGRTAPQHPGGVPNLPDGVVREAYSHEVSSAGFWFGDSRLPEPSYFSYMYPEPAGFSTSTIMPSAAYYNETLYEWILPYEAVRQSANPENTLLAFLESTYASGATLAEWDRESLER